MNFRLHALFVFCVLTFLSYGNIVSMRGGGDSFLNESSHLVLRAIPPEKGCKEKYGLFLNGQHQVATVTPSSNVVYAMKSKGRSEAPIVALLTWEQLKKQAYTVNEIKQKAEKQLGEMKEDLTKVQSKFSAAQERIETLQAELVSLRARTQVPQQGLATNPSSIQNQKMWTDRQVKTAIFGFSGVTLFAGAAVGAVSMYFINRWHRK